MKTNSKTKAIGLLNLKLIRDILGEKTTLNNIVPFPFPHPYILSPHNPRRNRTLNTSDELQYDIFDENILQTNPNYGE